MTRHYESTADMVKDLRSQRTGDSSKEIELEVVDPPKQEKPKVEEKPKADNKPKSDNKPKADAK